MIHVVVPILIAAAIPFSLSGFAKIGKFSRRDNHQQRVWQAGLEGWRKRAYWAQQNALETLPIYMAAVICAYLAHPPGHTLATIGAWAYPALRLGYTACYLADIAWLRSQLWLVSLGVILGLFVTALL